MQSEKQTCSLVIMISCDDWAAFVTTMLDLIALVQSYAIVFNEKY